MSECIEWEGGRIPDGYGQRYIDGRPYLAHRWAWMEANGPIPEGMCVCHHCDNPPCINPQHLFLGTQRDNVHDMFNKSRGGHGKGGWAEHGTDSKYKTGCRCERCRKAATTASKAWRRRIQKEQRRPRRHGTPASYQNYGCRCSECRMAYAAYRQEKKRTALDRAGGVSHA